MCSLTLDPDTVILVTTLATNGMEECQEWSCCSWTYMPYISAWTSSLHFISSLTFLYITVCRYSELLLQIIDHTACHDSVEWDTLLSLCQCGLGRYFTSYYSQVGGYRGKAIVWLGIKLLLSDLYTFCPHFTDDNRCQLTYWYHSVGIYTHAAWCSATMLAHWPGII